LPSDTFYTAIDIGNSKIASLVARVGTEGELKILGTGVMPSQGMNKGRIESIDEVRAAIATSLEEAQRYIGREWWLAYMWASAAAILPA
jgi:cell division protein FtsA